MYNDSLPLTPATLHSGVDRQGNNISHGPCGAPQRRGKLVGTKYSPPLEVMPTRRFPMHPSSQATQQRTVPTFGAAGAGPFSCACVWPYIQACLSKMPEDTNMAGDLCTSGTSHDVQRDIRLSLRIHLESIGCDERGLSRTASTAGCSCETRTHRSGPAFRGLHPLVRNRVMHWHVRSPTHATPAHTSPPGPSSFAPLRDGPVPV